MVQQKQTGGKKAARGRPLCLQLDAGNKLCLTYGRQPQRKEKKEKKDKGEGKGSQKPASRPRALSGPLACGSGYRLNVKNLTQESGGTVEQLRGLFEPFGKITDAQLKSRSDGKSLGIGFVVFGSEEDAKKAIDGMNGKELGGKALAVKPAERNQQDDEGWAETSAYWASMGQSFGQGKGKKGKGKGKQMMEQFAAMQTAYNTAYSQMWNTFPAAEESMAPGEYTGTLKVKARYGTKKNYISCAETWQYYASDINIEKSEIPDGAKEGDMLKFTVAMRYAQVASENGVFNTPPPAKGYPKAKTAAIVK